MKRKRMICIVILLFSFVIAFLLKSVVIWPGAYPNSKVLSTQENKIIKALLLDAVKNRCSSIYRIDPNGIYDADSAKEIIQYDTQSEISKSWFCLIDPNFMRTATKMDDGGYQVTIKLSYPEPYYYCFAINVIEGRYLITSFKIDI